MERDALKNIVIPKLNEEFMHKQLHISVVDLRHSVETDSTLDIEERERRVFQICMDEIDSCKPYFLGLIGHRYGWIPDLDEMNPEFLQRMNLPEDFPIARNELSVTVCEFLHGMFDGPQASEHSFVLMRNADSYAGLDEDTRKEYVDNGRRGELIDCFRTYMKDSLPAASLMEYSLDLDQVGGDVLQQWCDMIYETLYKEISKELSEKDSIYEEEYLIRQQKFISRHIVGFKGREHILQGCLSSLRKRGTLYLYQDESGLGSTSLACKLYTMMSASDEYLCLFHNTDTSPDAYRYENILYYWNRQILEFLGRDHAYLQEIKEKADILYNEFRELCRIVHEEKKRIVAIFTEGIIRANNFFSLKFAFNYYIDVVATGERSAINILHPYIVRELDDIDYETVTYNLRRAAREALSKKRQAKNIKWLQRAVHILEHLNHNDYMLIRSSEQAGNQEENISNYLVGVVEGLPDGFNELSIFWIERLKGIYGEFVTEYLYILSITAGMSDEAMSALTGRTVDWCTYFRHILGRDIVFENHEGYIEINPDIAKVLSANTEREYHSRKCRKVMEHLSGLPSSSPIYRRNVFCLAMHLEDYEACQKFIADPDNHVDDASDSTAVTSLARKAKEEPESFKMLIKGIIEAAPLEYNAFHLLNLWIRQITGNDHMLYLHMALLMTQKLGKAFDQKTLDSRTTLALVEIYDSIGGAYILSDIPDREERWKKINDLAFSICYEHVNESMEWNEQFLNIMYGTYEGFTNLKERWRFLEDAFIPIERYGIDHDESPGFIFYAYLLREYALLLPRFSSNGDPYIYIRKAYDMISAFREKSVADWLSMTLVMNRLSEDCGKPSREVSMALMKEVIEKAFSMSDKYTHMSRNGVLLSELVSSYAILLSETDRQGAMDMVDRMIGLCLPEYGDRTSYYMARHVSFMSLTNNIGYMDISFAWTLAARIHISTLEGEKVRSRYPLQDEDFTTLMKLLKGKSEDMWDRELDNEFILCTAIHSKLMEMQRNGFPDTKEAKDLIGTFRLLDNRSSVHYRKTNFRQRAQVNAAEQALTDMTAGNSDNLTQEELEGMIEKGQYQQLIEKYSYSEDTSREELYYLGLAYLRSGLYDLAMDTYQKLINTSCLPEGFTFSCKVNFLFAALAARRTSAFGRVYEGLDEEERDDSDVVPLYEAYCSFVESGVLKISKPYGYML